MVSWIHHFADLDKDDLKVRDLSAEALRLVRSYRIVSPPHSFGYMHGPTCKYFVTDEAIDDRKK